MIRRRLLLKTPHTQSKTFFKVRKFFGDAVRDPYAVIGVAKNAEFIDVKKKYFKLVKEHHPDINQDDPDNDKVFRRI